MTTETKTRAKAEHTPLPWHLISGKANSANGCPVETEIRGGNHVVARLGVVRSDRDKANAAFIVKAVNCHVELRQALEWALDIIDGSTVGRNVHKGHGDYDFARAALAKAEGRE